MNAIELTVTIALEHTQGYDIYISANGWGGQAMIKLPDDNFPSITISIETHHMGKALETPTVEVNWMSGSRAGLDRLAVQMHGLELARKIAAAPLAVIEAARLAYCATDAE